MMLNIESIVIDDIDIGNLKWTLSKYIVDTPVEVDGKTTDTLENCVNLGWNGAYTIEFDCPRERLLKCLCRRGPSRNPL